jgi:parallel beta-helix repeat protein
MKTISIFSSVLVFALLWGSSAIAGTLLVDDDNVECPNAGYNSIQAAVDAAASGDVIQVCPGTYDEQVEIAKPLSLVGVRRGEKDAAVVQPSNVIINADFLGEPDAAMILVHHTSDVTIKNITIDGINNGLVCDDTFPTMDGIFFQNASGTIEAVAIKNILSPQACAFADGLDILSTDGQPRRITVRDSSLHDYDLGGIFGTGNGVSISAIRNVITGRGPSDFGQFGIQFDGSTGLIEENIITNHVTADFSQSTFDSGGIGVFDMTGNTRIVRNIVGNSNAGMFVGAFPDLDSNGVTVIGNTVFNSDVLSGIFVKGDDNLVKDNTVTNSGLIDVGFLDRSGVFAQGVNNTIEDNTINEANIGLRISTGTNAIHNILFNTPVNKDVFVPEASAPDGQVSGRRAMTGAPVLKKRAR